MIVSAAEGGGLDQRAVDFRRGGVQRLADQQAAEQGIDQDRAVAVVPIQGHQAAGAGAKLLRLAGQCRVGVAAGRILAPARAT